MRLARSGRSSTLLSPRPARFPRRDSTPHAAQHSCAPLHSDAVFVLTGLVKRRRKRIREPCYSAAVNTILQLRAIFFLCCSLCFPFFLLFFLRDRGLRFFSFSVSFDSEMNWKVERRRERERGMRNERATTPSGLVLPTLDRRLFSRRSPSKPRLPTRDIYIYMLYFRRCFAFVFHRTMKETLRTICSLYFPSLPTEEERIFIYVRRYGELHELFATETRRGRGIIKI